jgi:hypothetical protein
MIKRVLMSLTAGAAIFGAAALIPASASAASMAGAAATIHLNAQNVSDVVQVRDRHRHRHHGHHHRHHHRHGHWGWGGVGFYAPYAFAPRTCGYVWSPRHYRHVYRCW